MALRTLKYQILTILLISGLSMALGACSSAPVQTQASQAQSQGSAILSKISQQAEKFGQRSMEAADSITGSVKGFLEEVEQSLSIESDDFAIAWQKVKEKLMEMKETAASEETQARIQNTAEQLEAKFQETLEQIEANENLQSAKTAITNFWEAVQSSMGSLTE